MILLFQVWHPEQKWKSWEEGSNDGKIEEFFFKQVKFKVQVGHPGGDSRGQLEIETGCSDEDLCLRDTRERNSLRNSGWSLGCG